MKRLVLVNGNNFLKKYKLILDKTYKKGLANLISPLCADNSHILDIGCDDGVLSQILIKKNHSLAIVGIDIQGNRPAKIPRKIYDGKRIPYQDKQFDITMAVDVLHHTRDIGSLLKEMKRVTKKYIIIKDQVSKDPLSFLVIAFVDWLANAPFGIKCTYNYPSLNKWYDYFKKLDLRVEYSAKTSGVPAIFFDNYNYIFKLIRTD